MNPELVSKKASTKPGITPLRIYGNVASARKSIHASVTTIYPSRLLNLLLSAFCDNNDNTNEARKVIPVDNRNGDIGSS